MVLHLSMYTVNGFCLRSQRLLQLPQTGVVLYQLTLNGVSSINSYTYLDSITLTHVITPTRRFLRAVLPSSYRPSPGIGVAADCTSIKMQMTDTAGLGGVVQRASGGDVAEPDATIHRWKQARVILGCPTMTLPMAVQVQVRSPKKPL